MTETIEQHLLRITEDLAYGLGITLYIRDGVVHQTGPGIEIIPRPGAHPNESMGANLAPKEI